MILKDMKDCKWNGNNVKKLIWNNNVLWEKKSYEGSLIPNTWTKVSTLPTNAFASSGVIFIVYDNAIHFWGYGCAHYKFDYITNEWVYLDTAEKPSSETYISQAIVYNNKVYLFFPTSYTTWTSSGGYSIRCSFEIVESSGPPRITNRDYILDSGSSSSNLFVHNNNLYLINFHRTFTDPIKGVYIFNESEKKFNKVAPANLNVKCLNPVGNYYEKDHKFYNIGGFLYDEVLSSSGNTETRRTYCSKNCYVFNPTSLTWSTYPESPKEVKESMQIIYHDKLYIFKWLIGTGYTPYKSYCTFDLKTLTYTEYQGTLPDEFGYGYAVVYNDELHFFGGGTEEHSSRTSLNHYAVYIP